MSEHEIYEEIALHMQRNFPNVIYRFDLAADLKLTPGQARKHKKLHPKRGYPDLFIAEPRVDVSKEENGMCVNTARHYGTGDNPVKVFDCIEHEMWCIYNGLFLEIKKDGESPFKKDGKLKKDEHLHEQDKMHQKLRGKGYCVSFAVGLDEAKRLINKYLTGSEQIKEKIEF